MGCVSKSVDPYSESFLTIYRILIDLSSLALKRHAGQERPAPRKGFADWLAFAVWHPVH